MDVPGMVVRMFMRRCGCRLSADDRLIEGILLRSVWLTRDMTTMRWYHSHQQVEKYLPAMQKS